MGRESVIYNNYVNSTLIFINCTFTNNKAANSFDISNNTNGQGGAIFNRGNNSFIIDCNFINNTVLYVGGSLSNLGDNLTLFNCNFTNNYAHVFNRGVIYASGGYY